MEGSWPSPRPTRIRRWRVGLARVWVQPLPPLGPALLWDLHAAMQRLAGLVCINGCPNRPRSPIKVKVDLLSYTHIISATHLSSPLVISFIVLVVVWRKAKLARSVRMARTSCPLGPRFRVKIGQEQPLAWLVQQDRITTENKHQDLI